MATYQDIKYLSPVNSTDPDKVNTLVQSILTNGWQGDPILFCNLGLVTGSHRLAALKQIEQTDDTHDILFDDIIAEDVTDQINQYCENNDLCFDEIDFRFISEELGYKSEF